MVRTSSVSILLQGSLHFTCAPRMNPSSSALSKDLHSAVSTRLPPSPPQHTQRSFVQGARSTPRVGTCAANITLCLKTPLTHPFQSSHHYLFSIEKQVLSVVPSLSGHPVLHFLLNQFPSGFFSTTPCVKVTEDFDSCPNQRLVVQSPPCSSLHPSPLSSLVVQEAAGQFLLPAPLVQACQFLSVSLPSFSGVWLCLGIQSCGFKKNPYTDDLCLPCKRVTDICS
jgi:hypothetical protein